MFNYAPTVNDNSGQIYGQYQLQGAQSLAQGMNQGSTGITDAIKQMNQLHFAGQQAQGTLSALKMFEDQVDPKTGEIIKPGFFPAGTSDKALQAPLLQQIGMAQTVPTMIGNAIMAQRLSEKTQYDQARLNQKDANSTTQQVPLY
jgi:hypothetical protein